MILKDSVREKLKPLGLAGALMLVTGLIFSPALISTGIAVIFISSLLMYPVKELPKTLWGNKAALLLIVLYLVDILCGLYTENREGFIQNTRIKLPLLLLPLALCRPYVYSKKEIIVILYVFISAVTLACLLTGGRFVIDYKAQMALVEANQPVQVMGKINHLYFSILLAFSLLAGIILLKNRWINLRGWKYALILMTIVQVIF
ncbi:MAG: hypothetical protein M3Q97_11945, partial [Bacteroidota bacterium]|nr:hypothetical protein [Bacteroidota bacterium]